MNHLFFLASQQQCVLLLWSSFPWCCERRRRRRIKKSQLSILLVLTGLKRRKMFWLIVPFVLVSFDRVSTCRSDLFFLPCYSFLGFDSFSLFGRVIRIGASIAYGDSDDMRNLGAISWLMGVFLSRFSDLLYDFARCFRLCLLAKLGVPIFLSRCSFPGTDHIIKKKRLKCKRSFL